MATRWRPGAFVLAALCMACGSSPSAPSAAPSLQSGNYILSVKSVTGPSGALCSESPLTIDRASVPVVLTTEASGWSVRPRVESDLGLKGTLQLLDGQRGVIQGSLEGGARDASGDVTVSIRRVTIPGAEGPGLSSPPVFSGMVTQTGASGIAAAELMFEQAGSTRRCTAATWDLVRR